MLTILHCIRYLAVVFAWSGICANAAAPSYNLVVGDGGYARLLESSPPLSDLTLTAWVNITEFPLGVAPIFTAVAPGAANQVAFFLRHDGLGVLWGGPKPVGRRSSHAHVDRHPRQWTPKHRKKRDAVDYSIGLGDIEDVLASKRRGRANDKWSPLSFTDVKEMGVPDLDTAATNINKEMQFLPTRTAYSRSESYNDWHNVPYELDMQESDAYEHQLREPAPRIITEPNGDEDDFVFINWNSPNPLTKQQIPESPNQWSAMNEPPKESPYSSNSQAKVKELPLNDNENWSSQVTEVKLIPDIWKTFAINQDGSSVSFDKLPKPIESVIYPQRVTTKQVPVTQKPSTTKQVPVTQKPSTTKQVPVTQKPSTTKQVPVTQKPSTMTPTSGLLSQSRTPSSNKQIKTHTEPVPITNQYSTRMSTTQIPSRQSISTKNILRSTTNQPKITTPEPTQYTPNRFTAPPTTPYTQRKSSTRMPLWKLINRPNSSERKSTSNSSERKSTSNSSSRRNTTRRTFSKQQTNTTPTFAKKQQTTTPKPTTKVKQTQNNASEIFVVTRPDISEHKSKVSIYSSAEDKWEEKSQVSQNFIYKHNQREVHEFEKKVMKIPSLVKEGDTAVVYSIPITNEDEFNSMYLQYQQQAKPTSTPKQMVRVTPQSYKEEEKNENSVMETTPSMSPYQNTETFQYRIGNGEPFKKTVSPAVYSEKDAVLTPTEEPLSPTPPRTSAPKRKIALANKPTNTPIYLTNNFYNKNSRPEEIVLEENDELEITNATSEKDKLLEREGLRRKTSSNPFEAEPELVYQEDKKSSPIPNAGYKQVTDAAPLTKVNYALPELVKSGEDKDLLVHSLPAQPLHPSQENLNNKLDNLNKPDVRLSSHEEELHMSQYQDLAPLHHEQVSPQYTNSEFQYSGVQTPDQKVKSVIYSADPEHLLAQGLLPRPVHYVSTPEEANRWMKEKQETVTSPITPAQDRIAIVDDDESINAFSASIKDGIKSSTQWLPAKQVASHQTLPFKQPQKEYQEAPTPEDHPMNVHFRKLPYNFLSNHWYHIAFTWSYTTHSVGVYINGNLVGNLQEVMPMWNQIPGDGLTILGQTLLPDLTDFDPTSHFKGAMNEVNLYSNTLTQHQIKSIYNCNGEQNLSKKVTWHQLSMRFYSQIHIEETSNICGISV